MVFQLLPPRVFLILDCSLHSTLQLNMHTFFKLLLLCLPFLTSGLNQEVESLLSLAKSLTLPHSLQSSWNSSDPTPCQWAGIICDSKNRVISLNLSRHKISGRLGPGIGHLRTIKTIVLWDNNLDGSIPSEITNCTQLEHLDLSFNSFTGTIPQDLENLQNLRSFSINNNHITGGVPSSLFMIPNLKFASLSANNFTGPIPQNMGNATKLRNAYMSDNRLSGPIPESIGNCSNLVELDLRDNHFTGVLPTSLTSLNKFRWLDVTRNSLEGKIPSGFSSNCKNLAGLELGENLFSGVIPSNLGNCTGLSTLSLYSNNLSGHIPSSFGKCKELNMFFLDENKLSGTIPSELGNLAQLQMLALSANQLTGDLPPEFGNLRLLEWLDVSRNSLTGSLEEVSKLRSLVELNVSYNNFQGPIPKHLVKSLNLSKSSFVGNPELCVTCPLESSVNCSANLKVNPCGDVVRAMQGINGVYIALIVLGMSMIGALCIVLLGCKFMTCKKSDEIEATEDLNKKGAKEAVYKDPREIIKMEDALKQQTVGKARKEHV